MSAAATRGMLDGFADEGDAAEDGRREDGRPKAEQRSSRAEEEAGLRALRAAGGAAVVDEVLDIGLHLNFGTLGQRVVNLSTMILAVPFVVLVALMWYQRKVAGSTQFSPTDGRIVLVPIVSGWAVSSVWLTVYAVQFYVKYVPTQNKYGRMNSGRHWDGIIHRQVNSPNLVAVAWRSFFATSDADDAAHAPEPREVVQSWLICLGLSASAVAVCWLPFCLEFSWYWAKWDECSPSWATIDDPVGDVNFTAVFQQVLHCAFPDPRETTGMSLRSIDRFVGEWSTQLLSGNMYVAFLCESMRLRQTVFVESFGSLLCTLYMIIRLCARVEQGRCTRAISSRLRAAREHKPSPDEMDAISTTVLRSTDGAQPVNEDAQFFALVDDLDDMYKQLLPPEVSVSGTDVAIAVALAFVHFVGPALGRRYTFPQIDFYPTESLLRWGMIVNLALFACCLADFYLRSGSALPNFARCPTRIEILRATWHEPTSEMLKNFCEHHNVGVGEKAFFLTMETPLHFEVWRVALHRVRLLTALDRGLVEEVLVVALLGVAWSLVCAGYLFVSGDRVSLLQNTLLAVDSVVFGTPIVQALRICRNINVVYEQDCKCWLELREKILRDSCLEKSRVPAAEDYKWRLPREFHMGCLGSPARHRRSFTTGTSISASRITDDGAWDSPAARKSIRELTHRMDEQNQQLTTTVQSLGSEVSLFSGTLGVLYQMEYLAAAVELDRTARSTANILGQRVTTDLMSKWIAVLGSIVASLVGRVLQRFIVE